MFNGPRLLAVAVTALAAVTACSGSTGVSDGPTPSPTSSPALSRAQIESQVVAVWIAEHQAFATALLHLDPNFVGLQRTAINPQLAGARAFIAAAQRAGDIARGSEVLGHPRVSGITPWPGPSSAVVVGCIHDLLILASRTTGKPVTGPSGEATWDYEKTTLTNVPGIGWVVSSNMIHEGSQESVCTRS